MGRIKCIPNGRISSFSGLASCPCICAVLPSGSCVRSVIIILHRRIHSNGMMPSHTHVTSASFCVFAGSPCFVSARQTLFFRYRSFRLFRVASFRGPRGGGGKFRGDPRLLQAGSGSRFRAKGFGTRGARMAVRVPLFSGGDNRVEKCWPP